MYGIDAQGYYCHQPLVKRNPNAPDPFEFHRLYGQEKYNLQNMLLAEAGRVFDELPEGYSCHSIYEDRAYKEWREAGEGITSKECADAFWHGVSGQSLMKFARRMAKLLGMDPATVVGMQMVRYTNVSSGYPCPRLDIIYKKKPSIQKG